MLPARVDRDGLARRLLRSGPRPTAAVPAHTHSRRIPFLSSTHWHIGFAARSFKKRHAVSQSIFTKPAHALCKSALEDRNSSSSVAPGRKLDRRKRAIRVSLAVCRLRGARISGARCRRGPPPHGRVEILLADLEPHSPNRHACLCRQEALSWAPATPESISQGQSADYKTLTGWTVSDTSQKNLYKSSFELLLDEKQRMSPRTIPLGQTPLEITSIPPSSTAKGKHATSADDIAKTIREGSEMDPQGLS